jgi:hypothetical protein
MRLRATGAEVAEQASSGGYVGIPYSTLDCQGFVEQVLKDLGIRKEDGTPYNWRGSNSMWRNYITWRGTIDECVQKFGRIPQGAFLFLLKNDGGERERGYHDELGNASHVGLYIGDDAEYPCMDSQELKGSKRKNSGVSRCKLSVFNRVGLMSMIDYYNEPISTTVTREEALKALETLTKFIKEVTI